MPEHSEPVFPTRTQTVRLPQSHAVPIIGQLLSASQWFAVEPLPADQVDLIVKAEVPAHLLRHEHTPTPMGALAAFVDAIDATGGVTTDRKGCTVPIADEEWADLGGAYLAACSALGRPPKQDVADADT